MVASTRTSSSMAGLRAVVRRRVSPVARSPTKTSLGEVSDETVKAIRLSSALKRTEPMSPVGQAVQGDGSTGRRVEQGQFGLGVGVDRRDAVAARRREADEHHIPVGGDEGRG